MRETRRGDCEWCGLRRVCFPGRLTAESPVGAALLNIRCVRIARGHALYRAGERIEAFHMLRSGCIKETDGSDGRESIVNFCLPGELLTVQNGASAKSQLTSVAVETSFVCAVPWRVFYRVCAQFPTATGEFIKLVAKSGAGTRELLTMIRGRGALERVAGFLSNLCARMQSRGLPARDFRLGMSREDIARYLGMRSETVSRCFTELARRGVVRVRAKRIQVLSVQEMRRLSLAEVVSGLDLPAAEREAG
ncbi:MAG TPA: helix-turn-helix domain-containing protein [Steroidobacteraceae bacterium]|nr:helix-turn-helix domain-containing protein [Steroidobacteraceae bacterium]